MPETHDTTTLVPPRDARGARPADEREWEALVGEYGPTLWAITKQFRLDDAESADAVQTTWLRLLEHADEIRDPERLAGWLVTTLRRVCLGSTRPTPRRPQALPAIEGSRDLPVGRVGDEGCPERALLDVEHTALLRQAVAELPEGHQRLLGLLMASTRPSYGEIATELGMPVGSIGPTRARILAVVRTRLAAAGLHDLVLS